MAIDPRISLGVQQLQLNDPLTQYGQVQNILAAQSQRQAAGTQNELAQAQLGQARMSIKEAQEAQEYITQVMAEAKRRGATTDDPMNAAMQMLNHPNPKVREAGKSLFDANQTVLAYQQDRSFANRNAPQPPPVAAPPVAGPSAPIDEALKMDYIKNARPGVTYEDFVASRAEGLAAPVVAHTPVVTATLQAPGVDPAPRVNNLPTAAPAAVAQTNALASPSRANELLKEINYLRTNFPYSAKAKEQITFLTERYKEAIKPQIVAPGSAIVVDGESIFTAKDKPLTQTDLVRNFEYAKTPAGGNYKGSFAEFKAISTPKTSVSYGPQEKEEKKEYGKLLVDQFKVVNDASRIAARSMPAIESNLATLDKGFDTGFGTETIAAGARVLGALGVQKAEDFATDAQTFLASASAAVLQRQLEQKGPQTEYDAQRITATGAQLGNTKEANRFVLNVAKAQFQRDIEQREFYAKWRDKNKTFEGAEDAWFAGPGGKSLFDTPALKKYTTNAVEQIPGSGPAPASNSVTLPDGRIKTFPNAEAANQFKKAAGIK
jgi:hypothetical protein